MGWRIACIVQVSLSCEVEEVGGESGDFVVVGFPDDGLFGDAGEQGVFFEDGEFDFAELGDGGGFDFSSVVAGHELVSGADA